MTERIIKITSNQLKDLIGVILPLDPEDGKDITKIRRNGSFETKPVFAEGDPSEEIIIVPEYMDTVIIPVWWESLGRLVKNGRLMVETSQGEDVFIEVIPEADDGRLVSDVTGETTPVSQKEEQ